MPRGNQGLLGVHLRPVLKFTPVFQTISELSSSYELYVTQVIVCDSNDAVANIAHELW